MTAERSVVIAAAGTGGHIYPGLALAGALRRRRPGLEVVMAGTPRGLENTLVPQAGFPLELYGMVPFAGRNKARLPLALARSSVQARSLLRRRHAAVAVSMGGYGGIPLMAGAKMAGVPSLIHESGAVAGRANKLASHLTDNVALAFDSAGATFPSGTRTRTVGMPLTGELAGFDRAALRAEARAAYGLREGVTMLLVVGGSQGSVRLNDTAVALAERWRDRIDVQIVLKTGRQHLAAVEEKVAAAGSGRVIRPVAYLDRMDHAYAAADMAMTRAGAGTVAELAVAGLPAMLVPYPGAVDDHQALNAGPLVSAGAAILVRDQDATPGRVAPVLERLIQDKDALAAMAAASASLGRPHAAEELADWVLEVGAL